MSAAVISFAEQRKQKKKMERLARQVEKDLQRVLSLLNRSADDGGKSQAQPA